MLETPVGDLVQRATRNFADRVAFKHGDRSLTYRQLGERVNRLANALLGLGLKPGDRVALLMWNCLEYTVADLAIAVAGLVKVPLNHLLTPDEITFRIQDSEAAAVITDDYFHEIVAGLEDACPSLAHRICIVPEGGSAPTPFLAFDRLLAQGAARPPDVVVSNDDLLGINYTGGTTGRSKGVMHTHKSVIAIAFGEIVEFDIGRGERMLQVAPLPHVGQFLLLPGLLRGATQVLMRRFDTGEVLRAIERERISWTFLVPTMIYMLIDDPAIRKVDHGTLGTMLYGAAPMSPDKLALAMERLGPVFLQAYSQMEVANLTTTLTKDDHVKALANAPARLGSCGRPVSLSQVKIVDADDAEVAPGEAGEINTRGPHMMRGYWRREAETAAAMRDGWIHTDDVAQADDDGYIYIVDRAKDVIISGGMNVYSVEVENALMEHDAVREACVIGIPDEKWGEAVAAFVVPREGARLDADALIAFSGRKLAAYNRPKRVEFVTEIPKTPYGKMDKKALRAPFWEGRDRQIG